MEKTVNTPYGGISYTLERKRVKNINLRVRAGRVFVSAPRWLPRGVIDAFVVSRAGMIKKALDSLPPRAETFGDGDAVLYLGRELRIRTVPGPRASVRAEGDDLILTLRSGAGEDAAKRAVEVWYRTESELLCRAAVERLWPRFAQLGAARPEIKMRAMRASWGNCRKREAVVTFNSRLAAVPEECIEYVAAHELAHLLHADHSRDFYAVLDAVMPDHRRRRALMKKYAPLVLS